jgi:F-type H+-transporting ATPase subunit b
MKKILVVALFLLSISQGTYAKEGMPQLNPEFWIAQIFWLIITFFLLFFLIQKFFTPKILFTIEQRKNLISNLIKDSEDYKNKISVLENEYNQIITQAKKQAIDESLLLKVELNKRINEKKKKLADQLNIETEKVEKEIDDFKKKTLDNLPEIAGNFSTEIIEKIIGAKPNANNLKAIISEITDEEKKSRYV